MYRFAPEDNLSDPTGMIQFGVLGVIVFLMIFGYLWAKPAVDQLKKDKERAEANQEKAEKERNELIELYQTTVIPALAEINKVVIPAIVQIQKDIAKIQADGAPIRPERTQVRNTDADAV